MKALFLGASHFCKKIFLARFVVGLDPIKYWAKAQLQTFFIFMHRDDPLFLPKIFWAKAQLQTFFIFMHRDDPLFLPWDRPLQKI